MSDNEVIEAISCVFVSQNGTKSQNILQTDSWLIQLVNGDKKRDVNCLKVSKICRNKSHFI